MSASGATLDPGRLVGPDPWAWRLAAALLLLFSLVWAAPGHARGNTPIFILHSYSQEYPWTKRQHEGFVRKLGATVTDPVAASVEYLDTKRIPYTADYGNLVAAHLARKYAGFEPRLIYVTDDNALVFAMTHLGKIFPRAPIFFSGINDLDMKRRIDPSRVTGVFEEKELAPNLDLMRRLDPGARDILVAGDESSTFQAIRREIAGELARQPDIRAHFLSSGRIETLVAELHGRKERFVFLTTLGAVTDAAGSTLTLPETIAAIVQAGRFIVISMEDAYLYPGVLGGYLTSGYKQGSVAAELAARYLAGTAVSAIKPVESSPNEYMIDAGELEKLGLTLPTEIAGRATILNAVPTFYARNADLIGHSLNAIALFFLASLAVFVYTLSRKNRQIARASTQLAAQGEQLRAVIEGFPVVLWAVDREGVFTLSRGAGLRALHLAPDELVGKSLFEYYKDVPSILADVRGALAGDDHVSTNRVGRLVFETHYAPLRDGSGAIVGATGVSSDVTERERAAQALRAREERFHTLFDRASDGIVILAPSGALVAVNQAFARMHGYSVEEMLKLSLTDLDVRQSTVPVPVRRQRLLSGEALTFEVEHYHKDGHVFPLEVSASLISAGEERLIQAFHRDITERKNAEAERNRLEMQLRESQKMEALGTLAGGVAHDFNNALATIIGNVELARQDLGSGHAALESIEEIGKASRRAKDLVQQILAFGRRQTLDRKATSLALVVVETARLMRAGLPARVRLDVDCRADAPAVLADATQVKQILLNLCANALHAVQDQERPGIIEVRLEAHTQEQTSGDLRAGRYACLTVRDNGPGMDGATRARIFEPFFTTKPKGKGTGLGLSVVHGMVQAHEASIEVHSAPGKGSTFRIFFPATEAPVPAAAAVTADATLVHGNGKHVLYVDDEEAIILLMKRLLERQGFRVSGYTDAHEALAAARTSPGQFDLAVTDYNMPEMSGLELARALKEIRADLPVVLASGYITDELRVQAPAAGITELIYKPNTVDELCEAVARVANAQGVDRRSS